ncbi:MAG: tetratricopeptide repeat protein [Gemmataceae bacterium]
MKAVLCATLVPLAALYFMLPLDEAPPWPAPVPFGWPMLLLAHVLCGLPLALTLGRLVPEKFAGLGLGLGLLGAALTMLLGATLGTALEDCGVVPRHLVRVLWCLALQLPWAFAFQGPWPATWSVGLVSVVLCLSVPAVYARTLALQSHEQVKTYLREDRLVSRLYTLAARAAIGLDERPQLSQLLADRNQLEKAVKQGGASRLAALLNLERYEEAARLLQRTELDAAGWRTLGILRQRQRRFAESNEALEQALARTSDEHQRIELIDSLAFNARESAQFARSEQLYREALERYPNHAACLHFRLGQHYHAGNRVAEALHHLRLAKELDPDNYQLPAANLVRELRRHTPGCLLNWP